MKYWMLLLWVHAAGWAVAGDAAALWEERVRPMVDEQCVKCHGPIEEKSGLVVDTVEGILRGGDEGTVVVPGKPAESRFYTYLAEGADPHMPPKKQLTEEEREGVRLWIEALGSDQGGAEREEAQPMGPVPADPAQAIDFFLETAQERAGVKAAAVCDDRTFVRRVWLDLAGSVPSAEVQREFVESGDPGKRDALIAERLAAPEYARTMRELWDVLLMGRGGDGRMKQRAEHGWHGYLERAFGDNRSWPDVVREIIVARPGNEAAAGSQWFLYEREARHQEMAEAVAPVIYGTRIDCAQCHDHPLAREIRQAHYWALVAAFNRSRRAGSGVVVEESAIGGHLNFTNLKKESQPALLEVLGGPVISEERPAEGAKEEDGAERYVVEGNGVRVPKFSRREALAAAVTKDNPLLMRAFVNRTWAQFFGRGLVHPVDEINSRNRASHPALLEWLTRDFTEHGGDVKRLVRAIVRSRAWQRAAWSGEGEAPPAQHFAAFAERPLPAETLARSVELVLGRSVSDAGFHAEVAAKFPDVMPREYLATTQQAMFLTNAPAVAALLSAEGGTAAVLAREADPGVVVRRSFEAVLGRGPDADEAAGAQAFLEKLGARRESAVRSLLWALVCGPEFLTNH
jgi:hypothetical protein